MRTGAGEERGGSSGPDGSSEAGDAGPSDGGDKGRAARMAEHLHERRERHRRRGLAFRAAIIVIGFLVVLGGVLLAAPGVPGPGFLVVLIGLAILALEFDWAERLLRRGLDYAERAGERAAAMSTRRKTVTGILAVAALAAAVGAILVFDIPIPFVRD